MRDVLRKLIEIVSRGGVVAYCRLVETRGSTPQKAGAIMLVREDGTQYGTLGGGCVEAEVKRRAIATLGHGTTEIAVFQLDSDYGWDDGLICGGRMTVLINPLRAAHPYLVQLADYAERGLGVTEAVVFDAEKSGLPVPSAYLFDASGAIMTTLTSDLTGNETISVPDVVRGSLRPLSERPRPYTANGVAFIPSSSRCRLIIVGGGHVGKAVGDLAVDLDFDVWVVDDREEFVSPERFPRAEQRIAGGIEDTLDRLEITDDTYCLIVTRGHNHDEKALRCLVQRGARYVGLIGSRRKIKLIFDDLLAEGVSPEALQRVHAPVGLDIGSQTVPEIAVSIAAELVAHRNRGGVVAGRPRPVAVAD
jgi:xanthine dehydrogenase accessory factor